MPSSISSFVEILDPVLKAYGFSRKGNNWYRNNDDSIVMVSLQASWPGPLVNLGVFYPRYGAIAWPEINECHVYTRLEALTPCSARLDELLAPASPISEDIRQNELQQVVAKYGLPWLNGMSKFDDARSFLAKKTSGGVFITPTVRPDLLDPQQPLVGSD
jgi:hypothetical protein